MPANSNAFYTNQYASAVELLAQQRRPRIASTFAQMTAEGQAATVVDFIDSFEADERTTLYDDIPFSDVSHTRPWVYPRHFDKAIPFDSIEKMQMNASPESSYVQGVVAALNRKMDDEAIRALFDNRNMGQTGTQTEAFNFGANRVVSQDIGGVGSGLNVEKIQQVLRLMRQSEVGVDDGEQIHIVISPALEQTLMNEIEVISSDFTMKRIMDSGTMNGSGYMGIDWIISNRLPLDSNGYRRVPVYTTAGMTFCTWDGGIKTSVDQRVDKRGRPWQVYGEGHFGAVRRDEKRVYEIKAVES